MINRPDQYKRVRVEFNINVPTRVTNKQIRESFGWVDIITPTQRYAMVPHNIRVFVNDPSHITPEVIANIVRQQSEEE